MEKYVVKLTDIQKQDIAHVGGKNASLGELLNNLDQLGIRVPNGFATTAKAFSDFLKQDDLDRKIYSLLDNLDVSDVPSLNRIGSEIRK